MKTTTILCIALMAVLLPAVAYAQREPDKQADAALAKLATEMRAAALKFTWKLKGGYSMHSLGVFVSKDGLALVAMDAVTTDNVPTVLTANGKSLRFGTILKLFPEQGVALMKFDHKPGVIIPVGKEEPEIGATIALMPWNNESPQLGKIPPVVGEIMLKRHDIYPKFKEPKFIKVLSFGSGLSTEQRNGLTSCFGIDAKGHLVASLLGLKRYPGQTLITLYPIADIADEIAPLAEGEKPLKHPLSPTDNPEDPATLDPDYIKTTMAMMQRDMGTARTLIKDLMKRYPNSLGIKILAADIMIMDPKGGEPLIGLEDVPLPGPEDSQARQFVMHTVRYVILGSQGENPILEMVKAIECSPKDCIDARVNFAGIFLQVSPPHLAEAADVYRLVYPYMSDTIHVVEKYKNLLAGLGKEKEAAVVNERFYELGKIYRQRRGEGR